MTTGSTSGESGAGSFPIAELDYHLPEELIAQEPLARRGDSRMLVVDRDTGCLRDERIANLPDYFRPGDVLVLNDTKVVPARFTAHRATGGRVRGLFVHEESAGRWQVMLEHSHRLKPDEQLAAAMARDDRSDELRPPPVRIRMIGRSSDGLWRVAVEPPLPADAILGWIGSTPLPPYIHRRPNDLRRDAQDRSAYQTIYARRPGAIAAPTAGLHLTEELFHRLRERGVESACVTLHVGVGTFAPIRVDDLSKHTIHAEHYQIGVEAAEAVRRCRERGGSVGAVGTTTVRVLETATDDLPAPGGIRAGAGVTAAFIYPPRRFRVVDRLLTNFHLPRSTLLALVMAFAGIENIRRAYAHAVAERYRFYSYGDAMLIV